LVFRTGQNLEVQRSLGLGKNDFQSPSNKKSSRGKVFIKIFDNNLFLFNFSYKVILRFSMSFSLKSIFFIFFILTNIFGGGVYFANPSPTFSGRGFPNIYSSNKLKDYPQITTDTTGKYVYSTWSTAAGNVQVVLSSDFGMTWNKPSTTPAGTPDLSGIIGSGSQIATDATGKYAYVIWSLNDGIGIKTQVAISSDYGISWTYPTKTPTGFSPDLSSYGSFDPQITTDATGKYVYATWYKADGENRILEVAVSSDYGVSWINPISTLAGISPSNLSAAAERGDKSEIIQTIAAEKTEKTELTSNSEEGGEKSQVSTISDDDSNSTRMGSGSIEVITRSPPSELSSDLLKVSYKNYQSDLLFQREQVNVLSWNNIESALSYRVYHNSLNNLVFKGNKLSFIHHGASNPSKYLLTWVDSGGIESIPVEVEIH
jgi:hypothetical protein